MTLRIFIGYDEREPEALDVCVKSMSRRSSEPLSITKLNMKALAHAGIYDRPWLRRADGQRIDRGDGKPFSTDFAFTRFLVPALCQYDDWALFCDSDFLFTGDISGLFELADERYAAMCVKHEHIPTETVKMDGQEQTRYPRKNWSSLVLWNCAHPANDALTLPCINKMTGRWLHGFEWLKDEAIGALPHKWNWLSGVDQVPDEVPCGIHFTLGIPTMPGCEDYPFADLWRAERDSRRLGSRPLLTEWLRAHSQELRA